MCTYERITAYNSGLTKVPVRHSADTFPTKAGQVVVNQTLVLRINPNSYRDGKITTFANPNNVRHNAKRHIYIIKKKKI